MINYINDFRVFLRNYIYNNYDNITMKTILDDLGLDIDTYTVLLRDEKRLSKSKTRKAIKMLNRFQRNIDDKELLRKLLCRIVFACNTCDIVIDTNYFMGKCSNNDNKYFSEITISDDFLCSYVSNGDDVSNIVLKKDINNYIVKYNTRAVSEEDEISIEKFDVYDKDGFVNFSYFEEKKVIPIKDEEDVLENNYTDYSIKSYSWRVDDFILVKEIEKQGDLEILRNSIGKNKNPDDKKLDLSCNFYDINDDVLNKYIEEKIIVNEVWDSVKEKVKTLQY